MVLVVGGAGGAGKDVIIMAFGGRPQTAESERADASAWAGVLSVHARSVRGQLAMILTARRGQRLGRGGWPDHMHRSGQ